MKKLLFVFLAFSMAFFIPGCGGDGGGENKSKAESKAAVDLDEYKFTWATLWEPGTYLPRGASELGDMRLDSYEKIQNDYNCTIERKMINASSFFDQVNASIMAGDKFADFIEVDLFRFRLLEKNKSLMALNTIKGFDVTQDKFFKTDVYKDDKENIFAIQYLLSHRSVGSMVWFNKTMLEKYGFPNPCQLVKENKWTFAKFEEMAKALTKENQWGMSTVDWHYNHLEKAFLFANNGKIAEKAGNKLQCSLLTPSAQYTFNYLNKLIVQDKVMAPRAEGASPTETVNAFINGQVGFFLYPPSGSIAERINGGLEDEWGIVVMPKGPDATDYVHLSLEFNTWVMLKNNTADAKKAAIVFDAISEPLTGDLKTDEEMFYEEMLYRALNGNKETLDQIKLATKTTVPDFAWSSEDVAMTLNEAFEACLRQGGKTPKAAMEAVTPVLQGLLNDFFNPAGESSSKK